MRLNRVYSVSSTVIADTIAAVRLRQAGSIGRMGM